MSTIIAVDSGLLTPLENINSTRRKQHRGRHNTPPIAKIIAIFLLRGIVSSIGDGILFCSLVFSAERPNNRLSNGWLKLCSEAKRSQLLRVLVDFLVMFFYA